MRVGPVSFCALAVCAPLAVVAQTTGSLGAGTGVVRYAGGSSFSAFTLSPTGQRSSAWTYVAVGGSVSLLKDGVWAAQGRSDLWGYLSRRTTGIRPAIGATLSGTTRSDGVAAGSGAVLIEAVQDRFALGAGFVTGLIEKEPGVGAFRLRGRTWWQPVAPVQVSLTTEATHFLGAWYTDVAGGASYDQHRLVASIWLSGRLSQTYGSTGAASAAVQYFVTPKVALEASGGNYLRDPFQGLPRAGFVAAGVRVFAVRRAGMTAPTPLRATLQPLVATPRGGDTVVVRFRMPGARAVAIAGSWNEWKPDSLRGLGADIWEAALRLPPGTYYFNLVVDGTDWVVPAGVATISDGMGGQIAVLNVL
jgi:Glycogen recognition site of AMP-activated protein kinase